MQNRNNRKFFSLARFNIKECNACEFLYADDTSISSMRLSQLQKLFNGFLFVCQKLGLIISFKKTDTLSIEQSHGFCKYDNASECWLIHLPVPNNDIKPLSWLSTFFSDKAKRPLCLVGWRNVLKETNISPPTSKSDLHKKRVMSVWSFEVWRYELHIAAIA